MRLFGTMPSGEEIYIFTLKSEAACAEIISYGAAIRSFSPFGRSILAGFESLEDYMADRTYHGATVGRVCNRIVGAAFEIDGVRYELTKNNGGEHCLHGGSDGYSNKAWDVLSYSDSSVTLGYTSPDGQSGFPGEVRVIAHFELAGAALRVAYSAIPDKKTPIMITSHGYFNLCGFGGEVLEHKLRIYADEYSEVSEQRLPTGRHASVVDTPFDFREARTIGERIADSPIGYDHNFIIKDSGNYYGDERALRLAAEVEGGGMRLSAYTDQPGVQLYIQKGPCKTPLVGGKEQIGYGAFCLEAQIEPNCTAYGKGFVGAGERYVSTTVYEAKIL